MEHLREWLAGQGEMPEAVAAHVDECAACQGRLEDLAAEDPVAAVRALSPSGPDPDLLNADRTEAFLRRLADHQRVVWEPLPDLPPPSDSSTLTRVRGDVTPSGLPTVAGYEIVAELGRGGMGVVYKAWQANPRRLVALKMLSAGAGAGPEELARFRTEAQAVARLQHPHIVQIYEVSEDSGRPYFAMEFVDGGSLAARLAGKPLPVRQAAQLMQTAALGIHHAHQRGIIHRDLTPGNILLQTTDDTDTTDKKTSKASSSVLSVPSVVDCVPKITDFGLAKIVVGGGDTLTQTGAVLGTPSYMAPEQAAGHKGTVTTATDVYGLGAILYAGLTGRAPFQGGTALEILLKVMELEPEPPRRSNREVDQDLQTICLKCLQKDPERRYASAEALAEDLGRWLAGEPIRARPIGRAARGWRWCRRHPVVAGLTAAVAVSLLGGIAVSMHFAIQADDSARQALAQQRIAEQNAKEADARAQGERKAKQLAARRLAQVEAQQRQTKAQKDRAEANARKALEEKQIADAVRDFLQYKLLGQADPRRQADILLRAGELAAAANYNLTIRDLLDRAATELTPEKIEANFPAQPLLQAEILQTMGNTYGGVGEYELAVSYLKRAAALRLLHLTSDDPSTLQTLVYLAGAYRKTGKPAEAIKLLERVRAVQETKLGPNHPDTLGTLDNLAGAYQATGKLREAIKLFKQVCAARQTKAGPRHPSTLTALNNLALAYLSEGKPAEAIKLLEQVRAAKETQEGADHPDTLTAVHNLAAGYQSAGRLPEAIKLLERVRTVQKAKLGHNHPDTVTTLNNLATAYQGVGQWGEAVELLEQVRAAWQTKLGPRHPATLTALNNLAVGYRAVGKLAEAIKLFEQVRTAREATLGLDHPDALKTLHNLAATYWSLKQLDKSIPLLEDALKRTQAKLGRDHPDTLYVMAGLGLNYRDAGKLEKAIPLLEEAYRKGQGHRRLAWVGGQLLAAYGKAGKTPEAAKLIDEFLADARKHLPADGPQLTDVLAFFGKRLLDLKQYRRAEAMLRECLALREQLSTKPATGGSGRPTVPAWQVASAQSLLGGALLGQKKYAEAEPLLLAGAQGLTKDAKAIPPQARSNITEAIKRLVDLYEASGKSNEAARWRKELAALAMP
jgi:hypothetical protein